MVVSHYPFSHLPLVREHEISVGHMVIEHKTTFLSLFAGGCSPRTKFWVIECEKKPCGRFPDCVYIVSGNVLSDFLPFHVAGTWMWWEIILDYRNKGDASWEAEQQARRIPGPLNHHTEQPCYVYPDGHTWKLLPLPSARCLILGSFVILTWFVF